MPADNNLIIKASGAVTTTTTGAVVDLGTRTLQPLSFKLNVTSITGATGIAAIKLQHCDTTGGTYQDLGAYANVTTTVGGQWITVRPKQFVKYVATMSGTTPNMTFGIDVRPAGRGNKF